MSVSEVRNYKDRYVRFRWHPHSLDVSTAYDRLAREGNMISAIIREMAA
ncbi:hypothetical protein EE36_01320 [Sulfitobacter sp. EE-36]|jgi:hypothetical protein|nr:hypothetical protein EE36_01320 [Sulfitobacter sp. EE-36]